jgi:coenzyme F420-reducing hydrogenase delta subunit
VEITCTGHLPPSFVDYVLSRDLADGVLLAGCGSGDCQYRFGSRWTGLRLSRERDPYLRKRVDNRRIAQAWQDPWSAHRDIGSMVEDFRESLPAADEPGGEPSVPAGPGNPWKTPLAITAYGLFALVVGWLSVWPRFQLMEKDPRFQLMEKDQAVISLSFTHAGQRLQECRVLSQEELNKLPPNMRKPRDCPRERRPVQVVFGMNGNTIYEASVPPTGFWDDGEASVYRRMTVSAGRHRLFIGMSDSGRSEGFDYELEKESELGAGRHVVVEFDDINNTFVFK